MKIVRFEYKGDKYLAPVQKDMPLYIIQILGKGEIGILQEFFGTEAGNKFGKMLETNPTAKNIEKMFKYMEEHDEYSGSSWGLTTREELEFDFFPEMPKETLDEIADICGLEREDTISESKTTKFSRRGIGMKRDRLVKQILENKKSVRKIIDDYSKRRGRRLNEDEEDLIGANTSDIDSVMANALAADDEQYRHLFVRRFHAGDDKPCKRSKIDSAAEALALFFEWSKKYKQDKVEIWTDVASDAKNFYRYAVKNREGLEDMWKGSIRIKSENGAWPAAYRDIQARARMSGSNSVGTLFPFNVNAK